MILPLRLTVALMALVATAALARAQDDTLADARRLFLGGKYAEAASLYEKLAEQSPVSAAIGQARCVQATGELDKASATLQAAIKKHPQDADLPAELASVAFERGDYPAARKLVDTAIKLDRNQLRARWLDGELNRVTGKLDAALAAYGWLVEHYNAHETKDADSLHNIGLGAAQFARWKHLGDQFTFLVNDLYPEILETEKEYWPAHYEAGLLFLEKYNEAEADKEFQAALALNPSAAEVHAAVAELALEKYELGQAQAAVDSALAINPRSLDAQQVQAEIHLANFAPAEAISVLEHARQLQPNSERTLGLLAAAYAVADGLDKTGPETKFGKLAAQVNERNPHAGEFYLAVGDALEKLRRFPAAARYYGEALERMPQLSLAGGQEGMILMRLGEEARAKKLLEAAFDADPFNVRVSNTLKVLEVLDGYETLETRHFLIRFDPQKDKIFARYAAAWLEEVYPQLCKQFGYEPPQKSLFEIFNHAKNTDGHGWFSARMVGLPHIHTIGACAGKMVALQSPTEGGQKFNWARVLKHEFVHVINLQQTDFNIPHWYTEGLAVLNEDHPRPRAWNELLAERMAAGKLFDLETINLGFIRPHSSDEWTLAYCQAELYAEYMLERFGPDALAKMLSGYADNLSTKEALRRAFDVDQAEFEKGYSEHLKKIVAGVSQGSAAKPRTLGQLQKELAADPQNADLTAQLALAQLNRRSYPEARRLADAAMKLEAGQQLAAYVRARLHLLVGENQECLKLLEASLNEKSPEEHLLGLLAGLRLKAENYAEAARLYELGAKQFTADDKWTKSLAQLYLKSGDNKKLAETLAGLAVENGDDLPIRKKLAQLALAAQDHAAAVRWANQALQIDVMDSEIHKLLADALVAEGQHAAAIPEYATALELEPDQQDVQLALAGAYVETKQPDKAKSLLEEVLKQQPDNVEAQRLLKKVEAPQLPKKVEAQRPPQKVQP